MFHFYHGNRLDSLAKQAADIHATGLDDPFLPELIIVQNAGMQHWLSLRISEHLGIAANLKFLFPAEYMWQLIGTVLDELPDVEPFRPGVLRWRIFEVLTDHADDFPELAHYLQDNDQLRIYQLAYRLEELLDRCLFYRPDWIMDWEAGQTSHWQSRLWTKLVDDSQAVHWVALQKQFLQALATAGKDLTEQRVLIFGIAQLSPGYLQLLREAARFIDVHIFLTNPCQQYWGDIVSESIKLQSNDLVSGYLETGNPLLSTMGRQGRDFIDMLISLEPDFESTCFVDNPDISMLAVIQNDILNLTNRSEIESVSQSADHSYIDGSISIQSCHTPMREIEVLYDQLLDLFNQNPDLKPEDIIVMMPSVSTYAAYIDAVFALRQQQIPYVISDRTIGDSNIITDILVALLEIPESRYEINLVLALLDYKPVRDQFKLHEDDVIQLRDWCAQTNICWGIDASMRESLALPSTSEHSWLNGIRRMLLGYIMNSDAMFNDILPFTEIEGSLAVTLGRFVDFADRLFELQQWKNQQQPLSVWIGQMLGLMNDFIHADNEHSGMLREIEIRLQDIVDQVKQARFSKNVNFQLMKQLVSGVIGQCPQRQQFSSGGVTFCQLTPMRSVPFQVICLLGMGDNQYPRPTTQYSFDLLANDGFRRGDRSPRFEERYLFLESLLAARKKFYISYVGRDVRKNTEIPPSVLVSELLDCIEQTFDIDRHRLITEHPLQAFSSRYYSPDNDLFTYSDYPVNREPSQTEIVFVDTVLQHESVTELTMNELIRFFRFPVRYFLEHQLGIKLEQAERELSEREPFELERFANVSLRQFIYHYNDRPYNENLKRFRALGLLPHGSKGQQVMDQEREIVSGLIERSTGIMTDSVSIQLQVGDILLSGTIENSSEQGFINLVFGKIWNQILLEQWIRHLVLSASPSEISVQSRIIHPQGESIFRHVEKPVDYLSTFLAAYQKGLNSPLHFMPGCSREYAKILINSRTKTSPLGSARKIWEGNHKYPGERYKPAYQLAFRGIDPLDKEFEYWAEKIWLPILEHYQE